MLKSGKYLISTDSWFYGPDGEQYRAVWGDCEVILAKEELGFVPTHGTNWFARIGRGAGSIIIAGCHIHYAIEAPEPPTVISKVYTDKATDRDIRCNQIYFPDGKPTDTNS